CDRHKGTWKKLASGPQADNSPDRSQSTIAGARKQEHIFNQHTHLRSEGDNLTTFRQVQAGTEQVFEHEKQETSAAQNKLKGKEQRRGVN
ncbi:hypothetical protein FQN60_018370, partial [Etheostoma spectabile]